MQLFMGIFKLGICMQYYDCYSAGDITMKNTILS
jgi:hypothetical protein